MINEELLQGDYEWLEEEKAKNNRFEFLVKRIDAIDINLPLQMGVVHELAHMVQFKKIFEMMAEVKSKKTDSELLKPFKRFFGGNPKYMYTFIEGFAQHMCLNKMAYLYYTKPSISGVPEANRWELKCAIADKRKNALICNLSNGEYYEMKRTDPYSEGYRFFLKINEKPEKHFYYNMNLYYNIIGIPPQNLTEIKNPDIYLQNASQLCKELIL